jgi:hypothetical protein
MGELVLVRHKYMEPQDYASETDADNEEKNAGWALRRVIELDVD